MTEVSSMQDLAALQGQPVHSSDGEKIGKVEEIFHDVETDKPEWIGVGTGFFSSRRVLVPVAGSQIRDDSVYVNYSKDQVKDSPGIDGDEISQEKEAELYRYYGIEYGEDRSDTGLPEGGEATETSEAHGTTAEDTTATDVDRGAVDSDRDSDGRTVTRSEEELSVGKRETEAGSVRLKKWVDTEKVQETVPTRREEVSVERVPASEGATAELGEDEISIPVVEEEAVVEKRPVVKEELRVKKEAVTDEEVVEADVRKERVDVDDSGTSVRTGADDR